MAETSLKETIFQYCKNPKMRDLFMLLYETSTGHDHDGTNSKSVTTGAPAGGSVTNAMMATDVKIGSLAALTTTVKSSVQGAINELVTADLTLTAAILLTNTNIGNVAALTTTAKTVVGAINELDAADAAYVTKTGSETLTNKTLTSPVITTMLINDGDLGVTLTSVNQTNAAPVVSIPDIGDAADTFCMIDTAQTLTLKTLTTPVVASFYQDAGKTKLMTVPDTASDTLAAIAATQTFTNKTLTTPVIASIYQDAGKTKLLTIPDTASDTLAAIAATQTLTNKTLTAPVVTSPDTVEGVSAHDYAGGASDWTLSASELKSKILTVTNSSGAVNLIGPLTAGRVYIVYNGTGSNLTVKGATGSTVVIATTKTAMVRSDGTNYLRVTADA